MNNGTARWFLVNRCLLGFFGDSNTRHKRGLTEESNKHGNYCNLLIMRYPQKIEYYLFIYRSKQAFNMRNI